MPDNKLELVVEVDVDTANASVKGINKGLSSFEQAARNAARGPAHLVTSRAGNSAHQATPIKMRFL